MKSLLSTIIISLAITLAYAQHPSSTTASASYTDTKTNKQVSIKINKDLRLKLNIDHEVFDLKLTYPKKHMKDFQYSFAQNFPSTKSIKHWSGSDEQTEITLRKNKIEIFFLKDEITSHDMNRIKTFAEDVLEQLDMDVEDMGLWEFSGNWSLSNAHEQQ